MAETLNIAQTMAARMRELREAYGLTLEQVAQYAQASKSHIWEFEKGRAKNPSIDMAVRIAGVYGVSLDYLTGLSPANPSLSPDALRIAVEIDKLLRRPPTLKRVERQPLRFEGEANG